MKKLLGIVLALSMALSMLAVPAMAETTEIQFWTWRPEDVEFYNAVIADFEAANPDIKVVQNAIKNTEYNTILAAALEGGSGPDVFMSRCYGGLQTFADSGYMLALDELVPELADFSATARGGATSTTDGKIYGVPAVSQTMLVYYNTAIYEELGLTVPTTWAEFLANLQACKDAGYEPLANGTKEGWCVEFLFGGVGPTFYGGQEFHDKVVAGETTFMDPAFVGAVEKITELAPYMPDMYEGVAYTDMQGSFINEMSAHFIGGSYEAGTFANQNPDLKFDIFATPGETADTPAFVSVYADMNYSIAATTKKQDAAVKFVKFLATKEFGERIVSELAMVSSVPGVDVAANPFIGKVLELQKNAAPYIFLVGFRYEQPTGSSLFQSAGQSLMVGDANAEETCKIVQDGIAAYYKPFQK